jgi:hypothetical protein
MPHDHGHVLATYHKAGPPAFRYPAHLTIFSPADFSDFRSVIRELFSPVKLSHLGKASFFIRQDWHGNDFVLLFPYDYAKKKDRK